MLSLVVMLLTLNLSGCGPVAIVGAVGSTVTNAAYNSAERDLNNPRPADDEQAFQVAEANLNLGIAYMREGAYEKALIKLQRATLAKPDFAPAYNVLGLLYQRLGDAAAAEENFLRAIRLEPSNASHLNNYGQFLCGQQRRQEAIDTFLDAVSNPLYDSPEIAYTNAGVCILQEDRQQAQDFFIQALNKNAYFSPALLEMADLSYLDRRYDVAYDYFQRYRKLAMQTPRSLWLGIRISHELGYKDDLASYALLLRNNYPETTEAQLLQESVY